MIDKKILLMILDGWGLAVDNQHSAISQAQTPFIDSLYRSYPNSQLIASGEAVGLPSGQIGNSEVGHQHLGAGRTVYQDLKHINQVIHNNLLANNAVLKEAITYAKEREKPIHLLGLVSDGGVHSHVDHLKALCKILNASEVPQVWIHAFTDGRDTKINSARTFIKQLIPFIDSRKIALASIMGRYYAMDRDLHWDRIKVAYEALVRGIGHRTVYWEDAIAQSYDLGITDEFIKPIILQTEERGPHACIQPEDVVLFFNFRSDRGRQLTQVLSQLDIPAYGMQALPLHYLTLTPYDEQFQNVKVLFPKASLSNTLGEVLSQYGKKQLRIAETEKYPHVTYFFSGGRENPFPGEERMIIPSPLVATYDLAPSMSAYAITEKLLKVLKSSQFDFICLNFANPDMVGHTGVWQATIEACQVVDICAKKVIEAASQTGYTTLVVSDHGNADRMFYPEGEVHTAHTLNPVPCILVTKSPIQKLHSGTLADVAPTILKIMHLPIPNEMDGNYLYS